MTAVEWLVSQQRHNSFFFIETIEHAKDLENKLRIEFAKFHVKKALEEALDSIPCLGSSTDIASYEEVRDAVLSSYSLDKIK
jgi:hypothetical protein